MNIIKVKDFNSMQAITVGLARNGYMVTADSVTDENYKEHWEIKYCEVSEIEEKSNDSDFDDDVFDDFNSVPRDTIVKDYTPPDDSEPQGFLTNQTDYGLMPRDKIIDIPSIPHQDSSDNITDEQMTVITSVSGN